MDAPPEGRTWSRTSGSPRCSATRRERSARARAQPGAGLSAQLRSRLADVPDGVGSPGRCRPTVRRRHRRAGAHPVATGSRMAALPPYDDALLRREMALFPEWFCGRHSASPAGDDETRARGRLRHAQRRSAAQPRVVRPSRLPFAQSHDDSPSENPGILDFQDAVADRSPTTSSRCCVTAYHRVADGRASVGLALSWQRPRGRAPVDADAASSCAGSN